MLDKYIKNKEANPKDKSNIKIAQTLKNKLGKSIYTLDNSKVYGSTTVTGKLVNTICTWYCTRFDWPKADEANRIKYNMGAFNKSLDAIKRDEVVLKPYLITQNHKSIYLLWFARNTHILTLYNVLTKREFILTNFR